MQLVPGMPRVQSCQKLWSVSFIVSECESRLLASSGRRHTLRSNLSDHNNWQLCIQFRFRIIPFARYRLRSNAEIGTKSAFSKSLLLAILHKWVLNGTWWRGVAYHGLSFDEIWVLYAPLMNGQNVGAPGVGFPEIGFLGIIAFWEIGFLRICQPTVLALMSVFVLFCSK